MHLDPIKMQHYLIYIYSTGNTKSLPMHPIEKMFQFLALTMRVEPKLIASLKAVSPKKQKNTFEKE